MRFFVGLIVGALLGGGGVYLALEKPWSGDEAAAVADAGPAVATAQPKKKKRRKRSKRGKRPGDVEIALDGEIPKLGAADRKLVWKGEAVKLPTKQVDFAEASEGRPLDAGEINQVIRSQSKRLLSCITSARGNAELDAKITVKMLVNESGRVVKTRIRAPSYLFAHGFYGCASKAARAMRFPATGAHTVVDAPYDLY